MVPRARQCSDRETPPCITHIPTSGRLNFKAFWTQRRAGVPNLQHLPLPVTSATCAHAPLQQTQETHRAPKRRKASPQDTLCPGTMGLGGLWIFQPPHFFSVEAEHSSQAPLATSTPANRWPLHPLLRPGCTIIVATIHRSLGR